MMMMGNPDENSVFELMNRRKAIEDEIRKYEGVLRDNCVGMKDSLLDAEEYPRSDIDVPGIREARKRINELNYDYSEIMKKIETGLEEYYRNAKNADDNSAPASSSARRVNVNQSASNSEIAVPASSGTFQPVVREFGLARVDQVFENSPAYHSGIRVGDIILRIGTVESLQARGNLSQIAAEIQANVNNPVPVIVRRPDGSVQDLTLVPRAWAGQGFLGCHILPLS